MTVHSDEELLPLEHPLVTNIYKQYETRPNKTRWTIGASDIGNPCDRAVWYSFRWFPKKKLSGRKLRLFETGHIEERRILDNLRSVGVKLIKSKGGQHSALAVDGHFCCHADGMTDELLFECKTASEKNFKAFVRNGVRAASLKYYDQMQTMMGLFNLGNGVLCVCNKNTDELYIEDVVFDKERFEFLMDRAKMVVHSSIPPDRMSDNPEYFECRWCDYHDVCHGTAEVQIPKHCRCCKHSSPTNGGSWTCLLKACDLSKKRQLAGCKTQEAIVDTGTDSSCI